MPSISDLILPTLFDEHNYSRQQDQEPLIENDDTTSEYFLCDNDDHDNENEESFVENIKNWALSFNISHAAVKELCLLFNDGLKKNILKELLPCDPRTLLSTTRQRIEIKNMLNGLYWHNGLRFCLETYFQNLENPMSISLNINIDGIPVFKSSKTQLWPILFAIHEIEEFVPMVIGIFCGGKPDANEFLNPFVDEILPLLNNGLLINGYQVDMKIRCFICDAPARSMIKGTKQFYYLL